MSKSDSHHTGVLVHAGHDHHTEKFEDILSSSGEHLAPWHPELFLEFLKREHNEENMYFYEEVEYLKATHTNAVLPVRISELFYPF
jgi:hypothetical protein